MSRVELEAHYFDSGESESLSVVEAIWPSGNSSRFRVQLRQRYVTGLPISHLRLHDRDNFIDSVSLAARILQQFIDARLKNALIW